MLDRRFQAAGQVYNACLGEASRHLGLMRQSRLWQQARRLDKERQQEERRALFHQARVAYGFDWQHLIPDATGLRKAGLGRDMDSRTVSALAKRAFRAMNRVAVGKARFKGPGRIRTLEGTDPSAGIRFRSGGHGDAHAVLWSGLVLPVRTPRHNRETIAHALSCRIQYVRLLRRLHGTGTRYRVQLVLEGQPLPRVVPGTERVGLDLNVHGRAFCGDTQAGVPPFAPGLADHRKLVRRLQRQLDRQRRANNPDRYREDGTIDPRRGGRWIVSRRVRKIQPQLADIQRRQQAQRANANGWIANPVVQVGVDLHAERVRVRAWPQLFGKSIGKRAPAGGRRRIERKRLSQRVHTCPCGVRMQRDLMSAYLARHVDADPDVLHAGQALQAWPTAEPRLSVAWGMHQSASSLGQSARGTPGPRLERLALAGRLPRRGMASS